MKSTIKRREFLGKSLQAGIGCCALLGAARFNTFAALPGFRGGELPDPKKLNYCGYSCPDDCKMKRATQSGDLTLKKEAYTEWRIEKKYGIAFDPVQVYCYGCKTTEMKPGLVVENCTVRKCAIAKGHDCCLECAQLADCDKEIWITFPDFHKYMIGLQQEYRKG